MTDPDGAPTRRERKKQATRDRIADAAARLFAQHGFDAVSMADIARAADVADQTVYNHFPTKPDLVLDRAEQYRRRLADLVTDRAETMTPADALRPLVHADIDRFEVADPELARGEFPALSRSAAVLRRSTLEMRADQAAAITAALRSTNPELHPLVAAGHAAALVAVLQYVTDRIGDAVIGGVGPAAEAAALRADVDTALHSLAVQFRTMTAPGTVRRHRGR